MAQIQPGTHLCALYTGPDERDRILASFTQWLDEVIELDGSGFVVTGAGETAMFATSSPGVFAVGDVRSGSVKRVASAVGEGAVGVRLVYEYLVRAGRR